MRALFQSRNFRLLCLADAISYIGDQVSLIAFPWLALALTGDPIVMAMVLVCQTFPRALLMLFGGAIVDRLSPRKVMIISQITLMILVGTLAVVLRYNLIELWMVFACALCFGVVEAFFFPASSSIIPSVVEKRFLKEANAAIQALGQMAIFVGPALAGFLIAGKILSTGVGEEQAIAELAGFGDREGLARAFFFDACTFGVSFCTLLAIRPRKLESEDEAEPMVQAVKRALRYVWSHPAMRLFFVGIAALEIFFQAPFIVGMPVLIKLHWGQTSAELGLVMSSLGFGALIGGILAGILATPPDRILGRLMFVLIGYSGLTLGMMAFVTDVWLACLIFLSSGVGDGFVFVHFSAWLQKVTPERMIGRVMAVLMFMAWALLPLSYVFMGPLIKWNIETVFVGSAVIIIVVCAIVACHPDAVKLQPLEEEGGDSTKTA